MYGKLGGLLTRPEMIALPYVHYMFSICHEISIELYYIGNAESLKKCEECCPDMYSGPWGIFVTSVVTRNATSFFTAQKLPGHPL